MVWYGNSTGTNNQTRNNQSKIHKNTSNVTVKEFLKIGQYLIKL